MSLTWNFASAAFVDGCKIPVRDAHEGGGRSSFVSRIVTIRFFFLPDSLLHFGRLERNTSIRGFHAGLQEGFFSSTKPYSPTGCKTAAI
jgi:hypothetical protein